jgi:HAD superfamily hydrolase (TIGR01549 family)
MKITSISFDFWNTIYEDHTHSYERHKERVKYLGDALIRNGYSNELDIEGSFKFCWEYFDKIWKNEHRTLNAKELLRVGLSYLKADLPKIDFDSVADFFDEVLLKYHPGLFDGVKDILPKLAENYKLGITSDTAYTSGRILKKLLEKDGLLECFSGFTFSDEQGCSKPDPNMFRNTMWQLGSKAHETIHVGDNEYTDIQGAKEEGLKTILFTGGLKDKNVDTEADYRVDSWEELLEVMKFV